VRPGRGALAALTMLFLSLSSIGFAGSAAAGGPTSVLLVVPGEGRTASLYNGSAEYDKLAQLVGAFGTPTGSTTPPKTADDLGASGTNDASGPGVTLTWLIHDVQVWRVDRVYLKADGGPLISTQTQQDGGDLLTGKPTWRTLTTGAKELTALLDSLGVGNSGSGTVGGNDSAAVSPSSVDPAAADPAAVGPAASAPAAEQPAGTPGSAGWIWGAVGVLVGIALTLGVGLGRRRWSDTAGVNPEEPRPEETGTEEPDTEEVATVIGRPATETLSSHPAGR
jgi:hypothetical protein